MQAVIFLFLIAKRLFTEAYNHNNTDQLTQIAGNAAINDAKGNLTEYEQNGKEYEVDYDLDNRIIKVDVDNNDVEYRYDALGRRVIRQEGTTKTALIWWGNSENAEHKHQAGQTVIQNDIMAHPSRLNSVIARAVDGSKFKLEWYHKNYLDHVYAVSDDSGDIQEHYRYTAFGEVTIYNSNGNQVSTTQIDNHILWNTRRRDEVTGFYMYKFRHYSAELGRWLARDPIEEEGGVNLYAFVGNDPVGRWDRLGAQSICSRDAWLEAWKKANPNWDKGLSWLQKRKVWNRIKKNVGNGCVGLTATILGSERYPNMENCFKDRAKAVALQKKMNNSNACCPKGSQKNMNGDNSRAVLFSVHLFNNKGQDGKTSDAKYDPKTGRVDLRNWDLEPRPATDPHPQGGEWINFDYGYTTGIGTIIHADHFHDPPRIFDSEHKRKKRWGPMTIYISSLKEWQKSYPDFNYEVWCVACEKDGLKK